MPIRYTFTIRVTRDTVSERGTKGRVFEKVVVFPNYIPVDYQIRFSDILVSLDGAEVQEDGSVQIYHRWRDHNPEETIQSLIDSGFREVE